MVMQWRHLKLLKWAGRGHDLAKVDATEPGQLAIKCLSCPYHGINLLNDFESVPAAYWFILVFKFRKDAV
jgi:hypothetical protein